MVTNARTPGARCYGYVTMSTSDEATECIHRLNRTELHGRMISVERVSRRHDLERARRAHGANELVESRGHLLATRCAKAKFLRLPKELVIWNASFLRIRERQLYHHYFFSLIAGCVLLLVFIFFYVNDDVFYFFFRRRVRAVRARPMRNRRIRKRPPRRRSSVKCPARKRVKRLTSKKTA